MYHDPKLDEKYLKGLNKVYVKVKLELQLSTFNLVLYGVISLLFILFIFKLCDHNYISNEKKTSEV